MRMFRLEALRNIVTYFTAALVLIGTASAQNATDKCSGLPDHQKLQAALSSVVKQGKETNSGLGNQEWAAVVNRDGIVCAVVFSGPDRNAEWPGSRLIAAEKANTANALSGPNLLSPPRTFSRPPSPDKVFTAL